MRLHPQRTALSAIDLLASLTSAALLAAFCLTLTAQVSRSQKRTQCLANLRQITMAAITYANDDKREQIIPIHPRMLATSATWYWKMVHAFTYGGDSAKKRLPFTADESVYLNDRKGQGLGTPGADYSRATRPLNAYILPDSTADKDVEKDAKVFRCPSDSGYSRNAPFEHVPPAAVGEDCFDILGNSYRVNLYALYRDNGEALSLGVWGQSLSRIPNPANTLGFVEPLMYEFAWAARGEPTFQPGQANSSTSKPKSPKGWHGEPRGDMASYADGHVNVLKEISVAAPISELEVRLGPANAALLLRGATWCLDTYPASATAIFGEWPGADGAMAAWPDLNLDQWPITGVHALQVKRP